MDIQIVLQHVFGFIGICTVISWVHSLFKKHKPHNQLNARAANLIKLLTADTNMSQLPKYVGGICTECKCTILSPLRSLNIKKCTSCGHEMEWNLDPGQMPLVRSNRMVKRTFK